MGEEKVLVMVLAQRQPELLERTLRFWQEWPNAFILVCPDRPTPAVSDVLDRFARSIRVVRPPVPVMSPEHGQCWTEVRNACLDAFDAAGETVDWEVNGDSDRWFDPEAIEWLTEAMADPKIWCIRAVSAFVWDEHGNINERQLHSEPLFGRYRKGWRRDGRFHSQVATDVLEHVRQYPESEVTCPYYLWDHGSVDKTERERAYKTYANAGKWSVYTRRYVADPVLISRSELLVRWPDPVAFSTYQHEKYNPFQGV